MLHVFEVWLFVGSIGRQLISQIKEIDSNTGQWGP